MVPASHYFKVTGKEGRAIGIRTGPSVDATKIRQCVEDGEVFGVCEIVETEGLQRYLRLADGRGWVFTHTPADEKIAEEIPWEQAIVSRGPKNSLDPTPEELARLQQMLVAAGLPT